MKTLTLNELNSVSGGNYHQGAGESFVDGAVTGGMVGLLVSFATNSMTPITDAAMWALAGGLVTTVLRN
jgi:bacteriocin-like protein